MFYSQLICLQILHELKEAQKVNTGNFFGALWESLRVYLLHQEKQVRMDSILLILMTVIKKKRPKTTRERRISGIKKCLNNQVSEYRP